MRDRKLVGSRQRSLSSLFSLSRRERPLLAGNALPSLFLPKKNAWFYFKKKNWYRFCRSFHISCTFNFRTAHGNRRTWALLSCSVYFVRIPLPFAQMSNTLKVCRVVCMYRQVVLVKVMSWNSWSHPYRKLANPSWSLTTVTRNGHTTWMGGGNVVESSRLDTSWHDSLLPEVDSTLYG